MRLGKVLLVARKSELCGPQQLVTGGA